MNLYKTKHYGLSVFILLCLVMTVYGEDGKPVVPRPKGMRGVDFGCKKDKALVLIDSAFTGEKQLEHDIPRIKNSEFLGNTATYTFMFNEYDELCSIDIECLTGRFDDIWNTIKSKYGEGRTTRDKENKKLIISWTWKQGDELDFWIDLTVSLEPFKTNVLYVDARVLARAKKDELKKRSKNEEF